MKVRSALVALAALLSAPLLTATTASAAVTPYSSPGVHSNAGRSVSVEPRAFPNTTQSATFVTYDQPVPEYVDSTCLFDLSRFRDFAQGSRVIDCGGISLSSADRAEKRTVPDSWGTWGAPPDTETDTPNLVWPLGLTSFTITSSAPLTTFGLEAEPNPFEVHTISVSYYTGPAGTGDLIGTVTREADGNFGAKLFAASSDTPFQSVVISSDVDFALAQARIELS